MNALQNRVLEAVDALTARYGCPAWLPMICQEVGAGEPAVQDAISALVAANVLVWVHAGAYGYTDVIRASTIVRRVGSFSLARLQLTDGAVRLGALRHALTDSPAAYRTAPVEGEVHG